MDIGLRRVQEEYFQKHKQEILNTNARFASILGDEVKYFPDRESLYQEYPYLRPGAETVIGPTLLIIDIGKETNSIEYRREFLEERQEKYRKNLMALVDESLKISKERDEIYN